MYPSGRPKLSSPVAARSTPWIAASMSVKPSDSCRAWTGVSRFPSSALRSTSPGTYGIR